VAACASFHAAMVYAPFVSISPACRWILGCYDCEYVYIYCAYTRRSFVKRRDLGQVDNISIFQLHCAAMIADIIDSFTNSGSLQFENMQTDTLSILLEVDSCLFSRRLSAAIT